MQAEPLGASPAALGQGSQKERNQGGPPLPALVQTLILGLKLASRPRDFYGAVFIMI